MANKPVRDWVYLAIIGLQFIGMLGKRAPPLIKIHPR